ncbi:MAG: DUF3221 domain-containing protein [Thermomonas sp.]
MNANAMTHQGPQMIRWHAFLIAALLLPGCGPHGGPAAAGKSSASITQGIPSDAPYIAGTITTVSAEHILVEENAAQASGSAKSSLRLTANTRILRRTGGAARATDLKVGQRVQAWVSGPVMESYPTQGTAAVIVIEPSDG